MNQLVACEHCERFFPKDRLEPIQDGSMTAFICEACSIGLEGYET